MRNELQLDTGDRVEFVQIAPGRFELIANTSDITELKGLFGTPKKTISIKAMKQAIEIMMRAKTFVLERPEQIARALSLFKAGKADFADCLIHRSAIDAGCTETLTFDVSAAKHAGMTLIQ